MAEIEVANIEEAQAKIAELNLTDGKNKPSDEEIKQAEKDFQKIANDFQTAKYDLGTEHDAELVLDFLMDFVENHVYWTKQGWMGVIKLHEELDEIAKEVKENKTPVSLGYQALEFTFYILTNAGGSGLKSARRLEAMADAYGKVLEFVGTKLEDARKVLEDIQFAQDRWNAMQQGFYMEKEDGVAIEGEIGDEEQDEDTPLISPNEK